MLRKFITSLRFATITMISFGVIAQTATLANTAGDGAVSSTVNTLDDNSDGACDAVHCSLREAIETAKGASPVITFASGLTGAIVLTSALPPLPPDVTIMGPGASVLEIKPAIGSGIRIFKTQKGTAATVISGLKMSGGTGQQTDAVHEAADPAPPVTGTVGGAIKSESNLRIEDCIFTGNSAESGAAIFSSAKPYYVGGALDIRRCTFTGNSATKRGGAIYVAAIGLSQIDASTFSEHHGAAEGGAICIFGSGKIKASTIDQNSALAKGGAIYSEGNFEIIASQVTNNSSPEGGAVYQGTSSYTQGSLRLNVSTFSNNNAVSTSVAGRGGAIASTASVNASDCIFTGNNASFQGGAVYSVTAISNGLKSLNLTDCTVSGNSSVNGGGIFVDGSLEVSTSTISGNSSTATANGTACGGGISATGLVDITSSTISGNTVTAGIGGKAFGGGYYYVYPATAPAHRPTITRSTISGNSVSALGSNMAVGGGIFGSVDLTRSTVYGNSALAGGGIYSTGGSGSAIFSSTIVANSGVGIATDHLYMGNSIVALNTAPAGVGPDFAPLAASASKISVGYNLIGNASNFTFTYNSGYSYTDMLGTATAPLDPKLGPLADNGGATQTCALLDGSPAIDRARNLDTADQRGFPLFSDFRLNPYPGASPVSDIGAYEFKPPLSVRVADITVKKSYAGTRNAVFKVELSEAFTDPVFFNWQTADDTAKSPGDYTAEGGTVQINPGETTAIFTVVTNGNATLQPTKTFFVKFSNPAGIVFAKPQAKCDIVDSGYPRISIEVSLQYEPVTGTKEGVFTATLDSAFELPCSAHYETVDGYAKAGFDYVAKQGTIEFRPGETSKTITISIIADSQTEGEEDYAVKLSDFVQASAGSMLVQLGGMPVQDLYGGLGLIQDYEPEPPTVAITSPLSGETGNSFKSLMGYAADNSNGSGLDKVRVTIRRNSDGRYWTGDAWDTSQSILGTSYTVSSKTWVLSRATPDTPATETYTIEARAYDMAGNEAIATSIYTVDSIAPASVTVTTPPNGAFLK